MNSLGANGKELKEGDRLKIQENGGGIDVCFHRRQEKRKSSQLGISTSFVTQGKKER